MFIVFSILPSGSEIVRGDLNFFYDQVHKLGRVVNESPGGHVGNTFVDTKPDIMIFLAHGDENTGIHFQQATIARW